MVGASNITHHIIREPKEIDKVIQYYGELWKKDALASERTPNIIQTIRNVLQTLPCQWRNISIDTNKVRLITYWLLYETGTAAKIFDAFVAAEKGDNSGLTFLTHHYDEEFSNRKYLCDYFSKAMSCGLDTTRNLAENMAPPTSIIGSPSCKYFFGKLYSRCPVNQTNTHGLSNT